MSHQELAVAVILQAWMDAMESENIKHRNRAKLFLTGATKEWRESLDFWCSISKNNSRVIMKKAREKFGR